MKILVTGREGQVVTSLIERAAGRSDIQIVAVGRPDLDLLDVDSIARAVDKAEPDVVVSAAAYTAVDQAEDERDAAFAVNARGAGAVAEAAAKAGAPVIHLSTDYVFPGTGDRAYAEDDATGPLSVYGQSKLESELAVAAANPKHVILRTAWVYSPFGKNFVRTMLRLAKDRPTLRVVGDQWGNPTSALDIADGVLRVAEQLVRGAPEGGFGTFHMVGTGDTNWAGFAERIFAASKAAGGPSASVEAITTADYPTKAVRPANSRLSTRKLARTYGITLPAWQASTKAVVERLVATRSY